MCDQLVIFSICRRIGLEALIAIGVLLCVVGCGRGPGEGKAVPSSDSPPPKKLHFISVPSPLGSGHRPVAPGDGWKVSETEHSISVPESVAAFEDWLERYAAASPEVRAAMQDEGLRLLRERRETVGELIATDPETAILLTPTPARRAILPAKLQDGLEQIVSGEGFYGVKAVCNHGPDSPHGQGCQIEYEVFLNRQSFKAKIYGTRLRRRTEEGASIYGVALDGVLALHQDDIVVLPGSAVDTMAPSGTAALIFRGKTEILPVSEVESRARSLLQP